MEPLSAASRPFLAVLEAAGQGMWQWDVTRDRGYLSSAGHALLGYRDGELLSVMHSGSAAVMKAVHPEDRPSLARTARAVAESAGAGESFRANCRIRSRGGRWLELMISGAVLQRNPRGRALMLAGIATDITSSRHQSQALAACEQNRSRLRDVVQALPDVAFMVDSQGVVQFANESAARIYGVAPHEICGRSVHELFAREQANVHMQNVRLALESGQGVAHGGMYVMPDGQRRWFHTHSVPLPADDPDEPPRVVIGIARDITQLIHLHQRALEHEAEHLHRAGRELHEMIAQSLVGVDYLASSVATGLRTIRINGYANQVEAIQEHIRFAIERVRSLAATMGPTHEQSLIDSLEQLAIRIERFHQVPCTVEAPRVVRISPPLIVAQLPMLVQEAAEFLLSAAGARQLTIRIVAGSDAQRPLVVEVVYDSAQRSATSPDSVLAGLPLLVRADGMGWEVVVRHGKNGRFVIVLQPRCDPASHGESDDDPLCDTHEAGEAETASASVSSDGASSVTSATGESP